MKLKLWLIAWLLFWWGFIALLWHAGSDVPTSRFDYILAFAYAVIIWLIGSLKIAIIVWKHEIKKGKDK
jgi:hypothetical protein